MEREKIFLGSVQGLEIKRIIKKWALEFYVSKPIFALYLLDLNSLKQFFVCFLLLILEIELFLIIY